MLKLLHLDASPRGDFSISRQLSAAAVAAWKDKHSGGKVVERDLTKTEMTFVDLDWIIGAFSTPDQLTTTIRVRLLSRIRSSPSFSKPTRLSRHSNVQLRRARRR
jgi:FMN-dependent NADH-azoreductase